ncbi:MAG: hypothetical protein ABSG70_20645 [Terriglobales bacterium]|jgi:hypothetical protein
MGKRCLVIFLCAAFAANAQQSADLATTSATIRLKNGRTIHADTATDAGDKLEYTVGESSYRIPKAAIQAVVRDREVAAPASSSTSRQGSNTSANAPGPPPAGKSTTNSQSAQNRYLYESTEQLRGECGTGEFLNRFHPEMQGAFQNRNETDRICKVLSAVIGDEYEALVDRGVELQRTLCAFSLERIGNSYNDPQVRDAQHDMFTVYGQFSRRLTDFRQHPEPDTPYGQRLQLDHMRLGGLCYDGKR